MNERLPYEQQFEQITLTIPPILTEVIDEHPQYPYKGNSVKMGCSWKTIQKRRRKNKNKKTHRK